MVKKEVNPLIWEELERYTMDENLREFIKGLLLFERKHISEERPRYSDEYDKLIEKHSKNMDSE
mgnify:CR=1 FL=1